MNTEEIRRRATEIRYHIVKMIGPGKKGHYGGSCSAAEIVASLYFREMRHHPAEPQWQDRDRFLFSKGHSVLAQYAALALAGYFPLEDLEGLKKLGSHLQGHPERRTPGIEAVTGSLGQGLSLACGIAAGLKLDGGESRVYTIMGDGEQAEGQIWEAAMGAINFGLDNLCAFIDRNRIQASGFTEERFPIPRLEEKWEAFGWSVRTIDGHRIEAILEALDAARKTQGVPSLIIADTVKGRGLPIAENKAAFHNGIMNEEEQQATLAYLEDQLKGINTGGEA